MADLRKTLFNQDLDKYQVFVQDTDPTSKYFNITELSDTFTGGKNAFLVQGSEFLVPDTLVRIELKDALGNIIYNEPGEGIVSASVGGQPIVTEYYEGTSKVVAVYIYPDTAYGPCTLTILGELSSYDNNGLITPIPVNWQGAYNVKWQKQINVNPSLPNTTKIRFYRRPQATIKEILSPIYRIESGSKYNSGVSQSFANIKLSQLETFAGDVKRIKVFRTSEGDISDYSLIQDILVESKELLTSYDLSGSVIGQTGILTSETLPKYWNTGSLTTELTSSKVESGVKLSGSGYFTYTSSLDIKSNNTYELNFDAFYSSSTSSNLGVYLSYVSQSINGPTTFTSSLATLYGTQPTKNLLDSVIPFKIDRDYPTASLYFSQSQGEWHLGNISLKLSQETAFSPDEISFVTTMPTIIGNETYNFKFEFYDVNNNYVPVFVTQSANFTGGNIGKLLRTLQFTTDRTAFRFSSGSVGNPPFQQVGFSILKTNLTGSVTYARSAYDTLGNYIEPSSYAGTYPGELSNASDAGATLTIANFSGSVRSVLIGSIVYTASCDGINEYETIYRFEDGDNAPGVFVTANTNQFIYKATDLSLNPTGQIITIEAKRKNLASATTPLTVNSGSGKPPLTFVSTNATNGVDTYTLLGTSYPYSTGETIYYISGSDQFGNEFSDAIKISPVKILDGLSVSLTNDNASLPAKSTGFVESGSFVLSSGSVSVKVGNETIQHSNGLLISNSFDVISATAVNVQTGSLNYTTTDYYITRLDKDSGSLNLTIRYKDGYGDTTDVSKLVTYTKNKKAAPVLTISTTNKAQSVSAKSTGAQIDAFSNATVTVAETYNGTTSNLALTSLTAETSDISSIVTDYTTGIITLNGRTLANGTNSTNITITAVVTDSEGISRTVVDTLTLSKVKKAPPSITFSITPQAQTVAASSAGTVTGTIVDPILSAFEGSSTLTYNNGTLTTSQYKITNVTGVTVASTTPATSTIDVTSVSSDDNTGVVSISYVDSEGTAGTSSIKFLISKAKTGVAGADGGAGPGVVYRGDWAANTAYYSSSIRVDVVKGSDGGYYLAKIGHTSTGTGATDKPVTGTSYTTYWNAFGATFSSVATDILLAQDATITRGLVMGTYGATDKGFIRSANASALMTGKGYYLDTTGSMRFGDPAGGYIKFTESEGVIINGNVTVAGNANVGGWTVDSDSIYSGTKDTSGYSTTGITLYSGGSIHSPNFYVDTSGNTFIRGQVTATSGYIGTSAAGFSINSSYFGNGKSSISDANAGVYVGTDGISLGPNSVFKVIQNGSLYATSATITGAVTATSGYIGNSTDGWIIGSSTITSKNLNVVIDSVNDRIDFKSGGVVKTRIKSGNVNIGSTTNVSVTIPAGTLQDNSGYGSSFPGIFTIQSSSGGSASNVTVTVPSGVDGNNLALVIPYPALPSVGYAQNTNMGTGLSCEYSYYARLDYTIRLNNSSGAVVTSGYKYLLNYGYDSCPNFATPFGLVTFPGFDAGTITIPSLGSASNGTVYWIGVSLSTNIAARVNPSGGTAIGASAYLRTVTSGWDAYTANGILVAVASRAEYGTNGVQIGSSEGTYVALGDAAGSGYVGVFTGNVQVIGTVSAGAVTASDKRAKTNVAIIPNALDTIKKLKPVKYDWLQHMTGNQDFEKGYGFIADDIQEVMPELVHQKRGFKFDDFKYLDYTSFHGIAIKAIQELTEKVEKLEAKLSGSI